MSSIRWVSAFLDFTHDEHGAGLELWEGLTGYHRSATRGATDEFVTLEPDKGESYLRVQRLGAGATRVHLDLHVADPFATAESAVAVGAQPLADHDDYLTLASPGGLVFCLVTHHDGDIPSVPPASTWPGDHHSRVDQVCLDIPPSAYDGEFGFWAALTGWEARHPSPDTEFARLTPPPGIPLKFLLQRLDDEQPSVTAHFDWCASDPEAEIARHEQAGATRGHTFGRGWTVMTGPAGLAYCITPRSPEDR